MHAYAMLDAALADAEAEDFGAAADPSIAPDRIGVARSRLYNLGYLWKDNQRQETDPDFLSALGSFQTEAGLSLNQALDDASWLALEQLVGFESHTDLDRWFRDGVPLPVLARAAHLRLLAFGLLDNLVKPTGERLKQGAQERELKTGLDRFVRVVRLLRLSENPLAPDLVPDTLKILFDQDRLVDRLAEMGRGMTVRHRAGAGAGAGEKREDNLLVIEFVRGIARIELWLAGFATKPRRQFDYDHGGAEQSLNQAMTEFWRSQPEAERPRPSERLEISGEFFTRLRQLTRTAQVQTIQRLSPLVEEVIGDKDMAEGVKTQMRTLGARLWDGIRRAMCWLSSKLAGIGTLANRITNLARVIKTAALGLYRDARLLLEACAASLRFILCSSYKPPASDAVLLLRDRDFDLSLLVDKQADPAPVAAFLREFSLHCRLFAISARFAGQLAGMVAGIGKKVLLAGWFGLALALARLSDGIKNIRRLAGDAAEILRQMKPEVIEAF